jgi:serine/threonine protein kinase
MTKVLTKFCLFFQNGFFFKVMKGELPPIPQHLKNETKDFIQQCLRMKPEDRPSARELLEHPFVAHAPPQPTFAAAASASGLQADSLRFCNCYTLSLGSFFLPQCINSMCN